MFYNLTKHVLISWTQQIRPVSSHKSQNYEQWTTRFQWKRIASNQMEPFSEERTQGPNQIPSAVVFTKPSNEGFGNFFHWVPMQEIGIVCRV